MIKPLLFCFAAVLMCYLSGAQNFPADSCTPTFQKAYKGQDYTDVANCILTGNDGSFVMAGYRNPPIGNRTDGFVQKIDSRGNVLWNYSIGGSNDDLFSVVKQLPNGDYIAAGSTTISSHLYPWLVKVSNNGTLVWSKAYEWSFWRNTKATDVAVTSSDNGLAICGYIENRAFVIKTDSVGNLQWGKTFVGATESLASGIIEDNNALIVTASDEQPSRFFQGVLMKLNEQTGSIIWCRAYDIDQKNDLFSNVQKTKTGYVIYSTDQANRTDLTFFNHTVLYTSVKGKPSNVWMVSNKASQYSPSFVRASDSGFLVTQSDYLSSDTDLQLHLYKVSNTGNLQWGRNFDFGSNTTLTIRRQKQLQDGGYVLSGYVTVNGGAAGNGGILTIRTDNFGNTPGCANDTSSKGITITSPTYNYTAQFAWSTITDGFTSLVFKPRLDSANTINVADRCSYCENGLYVKENSFKNHTLASAALFPNPVKYVLHIYNLASSAKTISIIDAKGKLLQQAVTSNNSYSFNVQQLSAGMYFIRITEGDKTTTMRFIKE
jgi:hypothetical protein